MKKLVLLLAFFSSYALMTQGQLEEVTASSFLNKISVTATAGTPTMAANEISLKRFSNLSFSNLNISYKMNSRFSFGISTMNNLSRGKAGYYNAEDQFFRFCSEEEEDDDDDMDDDEDGEDENDDDDNEGCEDDDFGQNLMGTGTFLLSDKVPFFVQAAAGYSLSGKAPAYSVMAGYSQKIVCGLSLTGGIRFSDVLYNAPADALRTTTTAGFKAEMGLSWNF